MATSTELLEGPQNIIWPFHLSPGFSSFSFANQYAIFMAVRVLPIPEKNAKFFSDSF